MLQAFVMSPMIALMSSLAILDGHSLAYRAFYALPENLTTVDGQITNAAFGFMRMLTKLLADHSPDRLCVTWDLGRAGFRTEQYPEYKAQRASSPETFRPQLPLIEEVLDAMGIQQFKMAGYEADDIIATMARRAASEGWDVLVVSGDRDAFQLVNEQISVLYPLRGVSETVVATSEYVETKYGVRPNQYVEYAALRGDSSDNLPGVPGVGEKTAAKLIQKYGSLEDIFAHVDEQTPKLKENMSASRDQVFLNRDLMTMVDDLDVGVLTDELVWTDWDRLAMQRVFESLEFLPMWKDLNAVHPESAEATGEVVTTEAVVVRDATQLSKVINQSLLVIDAVTTSSGDISGVSIGGDADTAWYVPGLLLADFRSVLEDPSVHKVAHHAKLLATLLDRHDITLEGVIFDTALAAYVVNPTARDFGLSSLADRYIGIEIDSVDDVGDGEIQFSFDFDGEATREVDCSARRTSAISQLHVKLCTELESHGSLEVFRDIEIPLVPVLRNMERRGIAVDRTYLESLGADLRTELATLETAIHAESGVVFNINSTNQLREVLFETLGLPILKKTSKGVPSTDASVLAKLSDKHSVVASLVRYRELEKLRGTYVDGLLPLIESDGRIRTTFNQMAAATGRLSSDHPNLQNIPVRSETGRLVRKAFVARPGWTFVVVDYSQIELRVLADMSQDPGLLEAFGVADRDIHSATAASVFGVDVDDITPTMRQRAKAINFGLLYGMEAHGLAERLEISREEAKEHIDAYFTSFPAVQEFMASVVVDAKRLGYTETLFGRRRYLPELTSDNWRVRQMGERMALNAPVQGTAADIIKLAMLAVERELDSQDSELILQVHDELVVETPVEQAESVARLLRSAMEGVAELAVPLSVHVASGLTLADAKA